MCEYVRELVYKAERLSTNAHWNDVLKTRAACVLVCFLYAFRSVVAVRREITWKRTRIRSLNTVLSDMDAGTERNAKWPNLKCAFEC